MKIGILADTHDNILAIQKAVCFFNTQELQYVIHAGDYTDPSSLKELMKLKGKFVGVFGNADSKRKELLGVCKNLHESPYDMLLDGKHIIITHMLESLSKRAKTMTDVIISAHTHVPEIKQNSPMYINPGECSGWINGKNTVAVLDLKTFYAEIIDLSTLSLDKESV